MSVLLKTTIGEIAATKPQAAKLFDVVGIDYACHGNLTLHDACAEAGLDPVQIRHSLDELPHDESDINWLERPLVEVMRHLVGENHPALLTSLHRAILFVAEHSDSCSNHPLATARIRNSLGGLANAMRPHMSREQHVLYPVIEHIDSCWSRGESATVDLSGGLSPAINSLMMEHAAMITSLDSVRAAVDEMMESSDTCAELAVALREFDHELRLHVHLQNNVAYPRAIALESIAGLARCEPGVHA